MDNFEVINNKKSKWIKVRYENIEGWVFGSEGNFFPNQTQLLEFIDNKYELKIKE